VLDAGDAVMDAGDAVMDTSGHNSTNLGDTSNVLVEGKDGNNNSLKPKNKKGKRKGENHKENVQDIYSPEGSLVRFKRKKLLILDLNGILADITTERYITRRADGRVRGKNGELTYLIFLVHICSWYKFGLEYLTQKYPMIYYCNSLQKKLP
jgi:hypothetical protein